MIHALTYQGFGGAKLLTIPHEYPNPRKTHTHWHSLVQHFVKVQSAPHCRSTVAVFERQRWWRASILYKDGR